MRIDLHTHSLASDGTDTPAELVAAAAAAELDVVALTDHDSVAGWDDATRAARRLGVVLVPGVEISCRAQGISVHMLAYLPDPEHPGLRAELDRTRDDRVWRARRMVGLIAVDYPLTWDDVTAQVEDGATVGRPHLADALVARGHMADRDEAFRRVLANGSPYYVGHYAPEAVDVVRMVRDAGGVAVMAHPLAARRGRVVSDATIAAFAAAGMTGLEADHRDHYRSETEHLRGLATDLGLVVTGSSDYHGTGKANLLGERLTDPDVLAVIEAAARGTVAVVRPQHSGLTVGTSSVGHVVGGPWQSRGVQQVDRGRPVTRGQDGVGQQGMLPGMPARLYACTPTRLSTWLDCPRRYRFAYLDRPAPPKGPPWAHNSMGAAVHSALADWWALPFPQRLPGRGIDLVRKRWLHEGFADAEQSAAVRERAAVWVEEYLLRVDPAGEPIGIERTVAARTERLAVSGRVDRIDVDPEGRLIIVDYKTGRRPPEPDDVRGSLALALYAVAAARTLRRDCARVELHHVPTGAVVAHEHTEASLTRKVAEAESIAQDAVRADAAHAAGRAGDGVFAPRPSRQCTWCDFRRHCPEGRAAAPEADPWAAVV